MVSAYHKSIVTISRNAGVLKYIFRSTTLQNLVIDRIKHEKESGNKNNAKVSILIKTDEMSGQEEEV